MAHLHLEPESVPCKFTSASEGAERARRDTYGRTLDDARRDDRNWFELRRRRMVRWMIRVRDLYGIIYRLVLAGGLGAAFLGLTVPIYGLMCLNWREPSTLEICTAAALLMVLVAVTEQLARATTVGALRLLRSLAAQEGIEIPEPVNFPWQRPRKIPPPPVPQRDAGGRYYLS